MSLAALACTGDPLLDRLLSECSSFRLTQTHCERAVDAVPEVEARNPALVFVSPALGDITPLLQVQGVRICWLAEGPGPEPPAGVEVIRAERLTPQLIDAWVRRPRQPATPAAAETARRTPPLPPPPQEPASNRQPPDRAEPVPAAQGAPPFRPHGPDAAAPPGGRVIRPVPPPAGGRGPVSKPGPVATLQPLQAPAPSAAAVRRPPSAVRPERLAPPTPRPVVRVLRQQVITFWGGKPGGGRSTLAVALADLLVRCGDVRVCTVDLNPYNSSLAPLLRREQEVSSWLQLAEAFAEGQPPPPDALRWIADNWAMVSGPDGRADLVAHLTPEAIAWLVDGLRNHFDCIILDPEARPGPIRDTAARLAHLVLVTVTSDYPDVLDTARTFEAAVEEGWLNRSRCRLILSRWLDSPHLTQAEVAECFGMPVSAVVPLSPEAALHASGQGLPVTRLSEKEAGPLRRAVEDLLAVVAPAVAGVVSAGSRQGPAGSLLGWLNR